MQEHKIRNLNDVDMIHTTQEKKSDKIHFECGHYKIDLRRVFSALYGLKSYNCELPNEELGACE